MKHYAKKKWGQNFLADTNLLRRIVKTIAPQATDRIFEIGPGEGALTERILPLVAKMAAIEIDPRLSAYLQSLPDLTSCHFLHGDVLRFELNKLPFKTPVRVVGNIPYNITSPLLFWLITQRQDWTDTYLMVQKELGERLTALVDTKAYGRLTVMVGAFLEVKTCFTIPPEVFVPRPKVDSTFIRLRPKARPLVREEQLDRFEKLVAAAFIKRRKMLRNSLKNFKIPETIGEEIDLTRRPETLTVEEFVTLAGSYSDKVIPQ